MRTGIANKIKYRKYANDEFYTPEKLAIELVKLVPFKVGDVWLDNAPGTKAFLNNFPEGVDPSSCPDFFDVPVDSCDWAVTNPPYSKLDDWFLHSTKTCRKGFAYLLGFHNITPRRIEMCEKAGFGLTQVHLCKVFKWFGISAFCVFEKGKPSVIQYDRKVWHSEEE
jgi:hypothetical protein